MPDAPAWRKELRELVWGTQWGTLDETKMLRLDELLQSGPDIRREYLHYLSLLADLQYELDSPLCSDPVSRDPAGAVPPPPAAGPASSAIPILGSLSQSLYQLIGGVKAGMGYCGCHTIDELRTKARFVRATPMGLRESHVHDVIITKEAPNYREQ